MIEESEIREAWERAQEKGKNNVYYRAIADALAWVLEESFDDPSQ